MRRHAIRRILVPTDFSPLSLHALQHARRLAALTGGRITLLHVVEPYADAFSGDSGAIPTALMLQRNLQTSSLVRLRRIAKGGAGRSAIRINCRAEIGPIAATIREVASSERAGLIIMGTHGTTGFVDNLLGSNTYRTSTLSRVPVLGVHARMAPLGYKHIIYPVREHPHALRKLPLALTFAALFKSTVHILGFVSGAQQSEKATRAACSVIAQTLSEGGVATTVSFTAATPLAETTMRFARKYRGALTVISQDSDFRIVEMFSGTFTKRILHKALSPVLIVPR